MAADILARRTAPALPAAMPDPLGVAPRRGPIEIRPPRALHEMVTWGLAQPCVDPCALAGLVVPG
eukprot:8921711-Pyramimonas_sp.AAC.2